jgi:hypothetical protein
LGIITAFKCHYRKQLICKTSHDGMEGGGGGPTHAANVKPDGLAEMHFTAEPRRLTTPTK